MPNTVILFHSALGLRPAVLGFADRLRAAGHRVFTPDLYDGRVFENLDEGVRYRDAIGGVPALIERANAACADLPDRVVYAGFSLGAAAAEMLAVTRPEARGLVLMHGAVAPEYLGVKTWPPLPLQIHYAEKDPWVEEEEEIQPLRVFAEQAGQSCQIYRYPGSGHLFADEGSEDYDRPSAETMIARVLAFLGEIGEA